MSDTILVVANETPGVHATITDLQRALAAFAIERRASIDDAVAAAARDDVRCVLVTDDLPDGDVFRVLHELHARWPELPIVLLATAPRIQNVVRAIRDGARDCLDRREATVAQIAGVLKTLALESAVRQRGLAAYEGADAPGRSVVRHGMVGESPAMLRVFGAIDACAATLAPVLILGETGTGKELIARAIHAASGRRGPMLPINTAEITDGLFESEMFGYVRGAFTGANRDHLGLVRACEGGTLFLDEIGELTPKEQAKLLRLLAERSVRPVGSIRCFPVDVRIVAATNRDLKRAVETGEFRKDLFYRLAAHVIEAPPLHHRRDDIRLLVPYLLARLTWGGPVPEVSEEAMRQLLEAYWPGNVRQLENVLARALVGARGGRIASVVLDPSPGGGGSRDGWNEQAQLEALLRRHGGKIGAVAAELGCDRRTVQRKMKRYGLDRRDFFHSQLERSPTHGEPEPPPAHARTALRRRRSA
jgi:DNA-binding NtrC family response regulator